MREASLSRRRKSSPAGGIRCGRGFLSVILLTGILFSSAACSFFRKPNLGRIYPELDRAEVPHPVILIPGFLGSKLRVEETGKVAWGRFLDVLRGGRPDRFALPITAEPITANVDHLVAYDLYDDAAGARYYGDILEALEHHGGYRTGDIRRPRRGENSFAFYYDWRRDIPENAAELGKAIERIRAVSGDPDLQVDLIAHSMGGLLARYYVLYGGVDILEQQETPVPSYAGAVDVDRVILIGTPNEGNLLSFKTLVQGIRKVTKPISVQETFSMPGLYQTLPSPWTETFLDPDGRPLQVDLYDPENWEKYGWSVFGEETDRQGKGPDPELREQQRRFLRHALRRAARFHEALRQGEAGASTARYFTFGSDCTPTLEKVILQQRDNGSWEVLFQDRAARYDARWVGLRDDLFGPGDGVVTRQSLLSFPEGGTQQGPAGAESSFHYAYFLCESHGMLTRDVMFQNNLFYVLNHRPAYRQVSRSSSPQSSSR